MFAIPSAIGGIARRSVLERLVMLPRKFSALLVCYCIFLKLAEATSQCLVPQYSVLLHEVNVAAEGEVFLLTEGRCYLACLREGGAYQVPYYTSKGGISVL